jgi:hypothetical protein
MNLSDIAKDADTAVGRCILRPVDRLAWRVLSTIATFNASVAHIWIWNDRLDGRSKVRIIE